MAQPRAKKNGTARIAVVGAESHSGGLLRAALAASKVPGSRVNLYGLVGDEAVISAYDGEARLIQDPNLPEIVAHDVVYLCEPGELAAQVIEAAAPTCTVIDLVGCLPGDVDTILAHPELNAADFAGHAGYLSMPHALSVTLAEVLYGVEQAVGVEQATATVLRPASDYGKDGVEELREQTVRLLSFAEVPQKTFGAQLAFNTLPVPPAEIRATGVAPSLEERISAETRQLLGWDRDRLALRMVTVPVFHGHGIQLNLRTRSDATLAEIERILRSSPFFGPPVAAPQATPLVAGSEIGVVVAKPTDDGLGGYWVWVVAGEVELYSASLAAKLAGESGRSGAPKSTRPSR
jgi:aspartate-semialdehyde dehydrogenase